MRKLHGRVLTGALATTLTVANMGALMPMTAFAAPSESGWTFINEDDSDDDAKTYTGVEYSVIYTDPTAVSTDAYFGLYKWVGDDVAFVDAAQGAAGGITLEDSVSAGNNTESGTIKYSLYSGETAFTDPGDITGLTAIASTNFTIADSSITDMAIEGEYNVKNIPDAALATSVTGNGSTGLHLTATETYGYTTGQKDIAWTILDSDGAEVNVGAFNITPGTSVTGETTYTETATITAGTAEAAAYKVVAFADSDGQGDFDENEEKAEYDFNVVADDSDIYVYDENMETSSAIDIGDTVQLTLYKDNKAVSNGVTWSLADEEEEGITISSKGLIKGISATTNAEVDAVYSLNDDLAYKTAYTVTVNPEAEKVFTLGIVDDNGETVSALEAGETATAMLYYGGIAYQGQVTWKSSNANAIAVASDGTLTAKTVSDNTPVTITATYKVDGVTYTKTASVTAKKLTYVWSSTSDDTWTGTNYLKLYDNQTATLSVAKSTGAPFDGTVTYKSSNQNVAIINSTTGLVTIQEGASNLTDNLAVIGAYLDGESFATITIAASPYEKEIKVGPADEELYYGQSATLWAEYEDEAGNIVDISDTGIWKVDPASTAASAVTLNGNVITVTGTATGAVEVNFWEDQESYDDGDQAIVVNLTVKADTFEADINDENAVFGQVQNNIYPITVPNMEVAEARIITATFGSTEVTSDMDWKVTSGESLVKVEDGIITALAEGINAEVTGTYKISDGSVVTTYTITVTIPQVLAATGALDLAETAITNAGDAVDSAGYAMKAAAEASKLAEATVDEPTEQNLAAAKEALEAAQSNLKEAQGAYAAALAAYDAADAAGAKSAEAKDKVADAYTSLEDAREAVANAEEAVADAEKAYKEADTKVTEVKKEEAIAAANKAADAAVAAPTEANIKAANDAVAAAKALGATDADLKAATDKIAQAQAAYNTRGLQPSETGKTEDGTAVKATSDGKGVIITETENKKSVKIGATVKVNGVDYPVVELAKKAITGKNVKNVTINAKNIKKVNKNAFKGAKNLKKVTIKGVKKTSKVAKKIAAAARKVNKNVKIVYKK